MLKTFIKERDEAGKHKTIEGIQATVALINAYFDFQSKKRREEDGDVRCRICGKNKEENGGCFLSPSEGLCSETCSEKFWRGRNMYDIGRGIGPIWP